MCCLVCRGGKAIFSLGRRQHEETASSNNLEEPSEPKDDFTRYSYALLLCSGEAMWQVKGEWLTFLALIIINMNKPWIITDSSTNIVFELFRCMRGHYIWVLTCGSHQMDTISLARWYIAWWTMALGMQNWMQCPWTKIRFNEEKEHCDLKDDASR
jgi:hypothetical protein